jgi:hypothetical protein
MKTFDVVNPFNTANRRLVAGASIREDEVIEPFSFEERVTNGFLKEKVEEKPKAPDAPVPPAQAPVAESATIKPAKS